MNIGIHAGLSGHFKFVATKEDGTSRVLADWQDNLILDTGLNRLGVGTVHSHCVVGSGSLTPAVTQTSLQTFVAATQTVNSHVDGTADDGSYAFVRRQYRFAMGTAAGNLSEVGIGWSNTELFSRALIRDLGGSPTTITVLSDEYLDVIYEIRMYQVLTDRTQTVNISGTNYDFTFRPFGLTGANSAGTLTNYSHVQLRHLLANGFVVAQSGFAGLTAMIPYATDASFTHYTNADGLAGTDLFDLIYGNEYPCTFRENYVLGSYRRTMQQRFDLNAGTEPFGGLNVYTRCGNYQVRVSPAIPKDYTKLLTINFYASWSRRT